MHACALASGTVQSTDSLIYVRILPGSFLIFLMWFSNRFNHELVFGVSVKNMNKAERLIFGESMMTHAMVLTAVTEKVESPSKSSDAFTDVFEYSGSLFVFWAHSQCVSCSARVQHVCHNTLVHKA